MSSVAHRIHDKLVRVQKPEKSVLRQYRNLCASLVDLAQTSENESTRVAAHRVIQEYIIKPLKQQYMEERKARAESKDSTPKSVNIAVSNLPVGAAAQVQIVNTGQQAQTQHNGPSRKEINTPSLPAISHKTNDDSHLAALGVGGEAAEKPGAALTNVDNPPHFLDISNEGMIKSGERYDKPCHDESLNPRTGVASGSSTGFRSDGLMTFEQWQALASSSRTSCATPQSSISGEQVKTYEADIKGMDRSPTTRRCPDCHALWVRARKARAAVGRRCLACGVDIGSRAANAVRCFRCSKAKRNQENVDWQRQKREMAAKRKKGEEDGIQ